MAPSLPVGAIFPNSTWAENRLAGQERFDSAEAERERLTREDREGETAAEKVVRFLPELAARNERAGTDIERLRLLDVDSARESLRGFMSDVRMIPDKKRGLVAEARLDGTALLQVPELERKYKSGSGGRI